MEMILFQALELQIHFPKLAEDKIMLLDELF